MKLNELKALMAASLLGGAIASIPHRCHVEDREIAAAVRIAGKIWKEVLEQEAQP